MRLSIAVMAISNLPSIRLVSWKAEPGVGVTFTATALRAKKPFSSPIQIGQLNPPGNTMSSMGFDDCACAGARAASRNSAAATRASVGAVMFSLLPFAICFAPSLREREEGISSAAPAGIYSVVLRGSGGGRRHRLEHHAGADRRPGAGRERRVELVRVHADIAQKRELPIEHPGRMQFGWRRVGGNRERDHRLR